MPRRPIRTKEVQSPDRILSNLLKDYVNGVLDGGAFLYRASVVKIDQAGGALEAIPPNPRNSISARVITNGRDKDATDDELSVFWPMFPHDIMPIKQGEHVYVIFEDVNKTHGLWLCRIPEPNSTDNANLVPGNLKYQNDPSNDFSQISADKTVQDTDASPAPTQLSPEFTVEPVPKFKARVGDRTIEGSNNTIIILGRDRSTSVESGQILGAGSVDVVVGRSGEDLDPESDKSRIVVSMNTDADGDFNISVGPPAGPKASIVAKSDEIRVIGRSGIKIIVEGGDVHVEGKNIFLGKDAAESVMKGNAFNTLWKKIMSIIATHGHPLPPNSPSPALAQLATPNADLEVNNVLSKKTKTE
jgi:hypothetical protein